MKLSDLSPATVADDACTALQGHITSMWLALYGPHDIPAQPSPQGGDVWLAVHVLTRYAQTGELPEGEASIAEYLISTIPLDVLGTSDDDEDAAEAWQLVQRAAIAREKITSRPTQAISTRELAILGSLSHARVRQLIDMGEVAADEVGGPSGRERLVSARDARRWLAARGVAGVGGR